MCWVWTLESLQSAGRSLKLTTLAARGEPEAKFSPPEVWKFNSPEEKTQNGSRLKSEIRRNFRGQRRVLRRRRQRMNEIRRVFARHELLPRDDRDALKRPGLDPWKLRTEAFERALGPVEFAVALGHIARHRGFKSNAKDVKSAQAANTNSAMSKAFAATKDKLAGFRNSSAYAMRRRKLSRFGHERAPFA